MTIKTSEETQAELKKAGAAAISQAKKLEDGKTLEATKRLISCQGFTNPVSDEDLVAWMDAHQVLYAEGLIPKWKREAIERNIPSFKWDVAHISPAFRALVIRANGAVVAEEATETEAAHRVGVR